MGGKQDRKPFDADAVRDGAPTSLAVILNWLREDGNYARWRGTNRAAGNTKEDLCREIMNLFHSHGLVHRTTRDVRNKMAELERSMSQAITWKEKVQSIPSSGGVAMGKEEVRAGILKCCKLYDVLALIMAPFMSTKTENKCVSQDAGATSNGNVIKTTGNAGNTANTVGSFTPPNKIALPPPQQKPQPIRPMPVSPDVAPLIQPRPASPVVKKLSPPPQPVEVPVEAPARVPTKRPLEESHEGEQHTPKLERAVKKNRLRLEARRLSMEDEKLKLEINRQQIQIAKEKALARQELRKAHIPEEEINRIFPYE